MPEEKKDVLEFPLEELEVPQAIVLMMQAAYNINPDSNDEDQEKFCMDRLQMLSEKLEARVEDSIEAAKAPVEMPDDTDDTFSNVDGHNVTLQHEYVEFAQDNIITKVVVDNVVFVLMCNERVYTDPDTGETSVCIKRFGHKGIDHEDEEGNMR